MARHRDFVARHITAGVTSRAQILTAIDATRRRRGPGKSTRPGTAGTSSSPAEALERATDEAIERGERSSWQVADNFLEFSKRGWTQQRIGERFGYKQQNVSRYIACAELYALGRKRPRFKYPQSSVSKFAACARNYSLGNKRPPFWDAYDEVNTKAVHVGQSTGQPEWYTPEDFLDAARDVLGAIAVRCGSPGRLLSAMHVSKFVRCAKKYPPGASPVMYRRPPFFVAFAEANSTSAERIVASPLGVGLTRSGAGYALVHNRRPPERGGGGVRARPQT
jgi:hypothetical protein